MENSNWREGKSSELIDLISGFAFKSANFLSEKRENTLPIIKIKNVANGDVNLNDVVYHEYNDKLSNYVIDKGDVLIAMTGNHIHAQTQIVGDVSLCKLNEPVLLNQRVGKFVAKNDADLKFAYYLFKDEETRFNLANKASGSANQANISKADILDLDILIPPLSEQKAIASVLSSLDDKIDLLHQQNQTLEALAETLFRHWFIEEAKEDWEEGKLGDAIEIFDSQRIPLSNMERDKKKDGTLYPYYGAAKIMDYINDYIFDGEYILFAEDGTVQTTEGYPVLQYAIGKFWVNNHTHVIKAKAPYNNFFLLNYLRKKNIELYITGAVQPKINQANLKSIDFPKFPLDKVSEFIKLTNQYFDKINLNNTQIQTLTQLRDTLLPKLMSGEVRVKM